MRLTLDVSDVGREPLEGIYPAVVRETKLEPSKTDPSVMNWVWEFEVVGPRQDGDGPDGSGYTFRVWKSLKKAALWSLALMLRNIGIIDEDTPVTELEVESDDATGVVLQPEVEGLPVMLKLAPGTYNGRKTTDVEDVLGTDWESSVEVPKSAPSVGSKTTSAPTFR